MSWKSTFGDECYILPIVYHLTCKNTLRSFEVSKLHRMCNLKVMREILICLKYIEFRVMYNCACFIRSLQDAVCCARVRFWWSGHAVWHRPFLVLQYLLNRPYVTYKVMKFFLKTHVLTRYICAKCMYRLVNYFYLTSPLQEVINCTSVTILFYPVGAMQQLDNIYHFHYFLCYLVINIS